MDGSHRRVLVQDDLGLPNGLTFDAYSSQLCWVDAGEAWGGGGVPHREPARLDSKRMSREEGTRERFLFLHKNSCIFLLGKPWFLGA